MPGSEGYLAAVELRLEDAVRVHGGRVAEIASETLAAGGKRFRPLLVFLATPRELRESDTAIAAGAAVELVHMATLVHDDLLDRATVRRGHATAWASYGDAAARAAGDYLFARAFGELAASGDRRAVAVLADATLALARGEALQRAQAFAPDTTVEEYLARCTLKTGKLFEAACLLGGGRAELGAFGLALGVAFQIADDVLDCAGDVRETGKEPGGDLREGTPTLPLILAAREDPLVHRALAGESVPDALVRVAETGALERSREIALEYARTAWAALDGDPDRDALEALAVAVVERER
ncbi:MAG: polyprenyl synthetase family protein [Actinobacteria bacterium]|nr:polyprenyl synthetase family protein [Actinomycetota bacterium]